MVIAFAIPAFAGISDYESMHKRLVDVLGSQADAAYDRLGGGSVHRAVHGE